MTHYIYPQNLKATANMWLWSLKDFAIISVAALLSVAVIALTKFIVPLALTLVYGFLTIRADDMRIMDYIKNAAKYLFSTQQYFEWM